MSVEQKNEGAGDGSNTGAAGEQGTKDATQPSPQRGGPDTFRIGTKEEIRAAGGGEGDAGKSEPREVLRDGTR